MLFFVFIFYFTMVTETNLFIIKMCTKYFDFSVRQCSHTVSEIVIFVIVLFIDNK